MQVRKNIGILEGFSKEEHESITVTGYILIREYSEAKHSIVIKDNESKTMLCNLIMNGWVIETIFYTKKLI